MQKKLSPLMGACKSIALACLLLVVIGVYLLSFVNPRTATAAASNTINFQARLMSAAGAIVPDGDYNVEFKLYNALTSSGSSQGSCSGDAACLWTETRTSTNKVHIANGYLTVELGSVTALPTSIDWSQNMYLTMNIGGTGTPGWDGEMSPRLHLTAVPHAFTADQLKNTNGSFTSTLGFIAPTANRTINLPDESGTLCIQNSATCGFALSSGSTNYIQNQNSSDQTANFRIDGTGRAGTALQAPLFDTATATALGIGTTNATAINLNKSTTITGGITQSGGAISLAGNAASSITSTSGLTLTAGATSSWTVGGTNQSLTITTSGTGTLILGTTGAGTVTMGSSSATVNIATTNVAHTVHIADGGTSTTQAVTMGSTNGSSSTTVQGGTGANAIALSTGTNGNIKLTTTGTGTINLTTGSAGVIVKPTTDNSSAFQVQNAAGSYILNVNTVFGIVNIGLLNIGFGTNLATIDTTNSGDTLSIGATNAGTVTIGRAAGTTTIQGGTSSTAISLNTAANGKIALSTSGTGGVTANLGSAGMILQTTTNSAYALQVLDSGGTQLFNVNTSSGSIFLSAAQVDYSGFDSTIRAPFGSITLGQSNQTTNIVGSSSSTIQATSGSFKTTVGFVAPTANRTINFGNESGTVCLQGATSCGFLTGSASNYIQNTTTAQSANMAVQAATSGSVAAVLQANAAGVGDILQLKNGAGTAVATFGSAGAALFKNSTNSATAFAIQNAAGTSLFNIDTTSNGLVTLGSGLRLNVTSANATTFTTPLAFSVPTAINIPLYNPGAYGQLLAFGLPSTADSTARAISVFDARSSGTIQPAIALFSPNENDVFGLSWNGLNTTASLETVGSSAIALRPGGTNVKLWAGSTGVAIGSNVSSASYPLDVTGDINTSTQLRIGGAVICTASGCLTSGGSYIQNTTTVQSANMYVQAATSGSVAAVLQANAAGAGDILDLKNGAGTNVATFSSTGAVLLKNSTNSVTAFEVQNAAGASVLTVDTTNKRIGINNNAPSVDLEVGPATLTAGQIVQIRVGDFLLQSQQGGANGLAALTSRGSNGNLTLDGASGSALYLAPFTTNNIYMATGGGKVAVGNVGAPALKFEVQGGDAAVYNSGNNARLVLGDNATSGQYGFLQWDSANDYFRIETAGTNGVKIKDNYMSIGNIAPTKPLIVGNGTNALFEVGTTGQIQARTSTNATTAFQIQDSTSAVFFDADSTNKRIGIGNGLVAPEVTLDVNGVIQQTGMSTSDTGAADNNKWTKLGTCTLTAQFTQCLTTISILGGHDGSTANNTQGTVSVRVKQQNAMGGAPYVNVNLNDTAEVITKSDIAAVTTVNTGATTTVELYGRITNTFEHWYYTPILNTGNGTATNWDWSPLNGFVAALPGGTQTIARYGNLNANLMTVEASNTAAMTIQNAGGTNKLFVADTTNLRIAVNQATAAYTLDVAGDINTTTQYRIGGTAVCTATGCTASSTSAILNQATVQSANFYVQAATSGSVAGVLRANAAGVGNILNLQNGAGTNIATFGSAGAVTLQNSTNSTSAFVIQAAAGGGGNAVFRVDTTNERVAIGVIADPIAAKLNIATSTTVSLRAYQGSTNNILELANATGDVLTVKSTGELNMRTRTDSSTGFQVQNSAGTQVMSVNTVDNIMMLGTGFGGRHIAFDIENDPYLEVVDSTGTRGIGLVQVESGGDSYLTHDADLVIQRSTTSTTDLEVLSPTDDSNILAVDSVNSRVVLGTSDTNGTILVLDTKTSAGDPTGVEGAMYYNSSSKSFRCYMNARWRSCVSGVVFANTTVPAAVSNTTTETNFAQNYSIPANDCQPGRVYRVTAQGLWTNTSGAAANLTLKVKAGSTALHTAVANSTATGGTNLAWRIEFQITCVTTGASGTVEAQGYWQRSTSTTAAGVTQLSNTGTVTMDTTAAQTLQISAQWGTAASTLSTTMRQIIIEASGP